MNDNRLGGVSKMIGWVVLIAVTWLVVLPWLSDRGSTKVYLQRLRQRNIDPAAMYYTELPPELFLDYDDHEPKD